MSINPYGHLPPASQPEALAYDIHVLAAHALQNPTDYGTAQGANLAVALRADSADSTAAVDDIATVAGWVLFVTQFNLHYAPWSREQSEVRSAASRVLALLDACQSHASHLTHRTGDS